MPLQRKTLPPRTVPNNSPAPSPDTERRSIRHAEACWRASPAMRQAGRCLPVRRIAIAWLVLLERVAGIEPAYSTWKADVFLDDFNARFHAVSKFLTFCAPLLSWFHIRTEPTTAFQSYAWGVGTRTVLPLIWCSLTKLVTGLPPNVSTAISLCTNCDNLHRYGAPR